MDAGALYDALDVAVPESDADALYDKLEEALPE